MHGLASRPIMGLLRNPCKGISYYLLIGEKFAYLHCLFTHECLVILLMNGLLSVGKVAVVATEYLVNIARHTFASEVACTTDGIIVIFGFALEA